ncbi:ACT domain-containing protein [Fretibacterium sp. OH1220_COT-178]|uniref:ACT domain-containing protein n=1 Tax=Fretibacterium sp. OH1220_COT-178 TaxID=2491047 RepID=UPI000F5F5EED|nr:ACT domain-containing protein [Fretibacterium sp. OH1220_COT-178]RRD64502.1 ACT domain-containing protein [Fretibacterium sp. OH1220_COT-178]
MQKSTIESIRIDRGCARIILLGVPDLPGVAATVFSSLSEKNVGVEMIVQNNMRGGMTDMTFLIRKDRLDDAIPVCRAAAESIRAQGVSFNTEVASVSIQGRDLSSSPEIAAKMFATLASVNVNIGMITSSALAVTCVVDATAVDRAVEALEGTFGVKPA